MKHFQGNGSYGRSLAAGLLAGVAVVAFAAVPASAQGQSSPPSGGQRSLQAPSADRAKMQKVMQEYQQLTDELNEIQKAALESNPELQKQRDEFQSLLEEKMSKEGYDAAAGEKKLKDLQDSLNSEDLEPAKKQELMSEFQTARGEMAKAHRSAMNDPEVQKARTALQNDVIAAMKEESDKTEELVSELEAIQSKMQKMSAGMQQRGGPSAAPPGAGGK